MFDSMVGFFWFAVCSVLVKDDAGFESCVFADCWWPSRLSVLVRTWFKQVHSFVYFSSYLCMSCLSLQNLHMLTFISLFSLSVVQFKEFLNVYAVLCSEGAPWEMMI